jgi:hypothetical protein
MMPSVVFKVTPLAKDFKIALLTVCRIVVKVGDCQVYDFTSERMKLFILSFALLAFVSGGLN